MTATAKVTHDETEFDRHVAEARARYGAARWDALHAAVVEAALLHQPQLLSIETSPRPSAATFLEC